MSIFVESTDCYNRDFGMLYLCRKCSAWVGVHEGTDKAKGRLANAELRHWKRQAHSSFDKIWKRQLLLGIPKHKARNEAYAWIAKQMNKDVKDTHIGMFDIEQCKQVIELCDSYQFPKEQALQTQKPKVNIVLRDRKADYEENKYITQKVRYQEKAKELMLKWCVDKKVSAVEIQPYQIRFSNAHKKIDIFPQSRRYHDILTNKRGSYKNLLNFLDTEFLD